MITLTQKEELAALVSASLDNAEKRYDQVEHFMEKAARLDHVATPYPGVPFITSDKAVARTYVALVLDIRDSTEHLDEPVRGCSGIRRLYLETSALLPATGVLVGYDSGKVAEYVGDGLIALFSVAEAPTAKSLSKIHQRAEDILELNEKIVGPELRRRYHFPFLRVGVGLAFGHVMVTAIGLPGDERALAYGKPIYQASHLSKGENQIVVAPSLRTVWPKGEGGKVQFTEVTVRDSFGFELTRSD